MSRGNSKTGLGRGRPRLQYGRCRVSSKSYRHQAGPRRRFAFRSENEEAIPGAQKARSQQESLAGYPVGQQPIQQAREVIFALLCRLHILLGESNQDGFLPFPTVFCFNHLKIYIQFLLTKSEFIYILSSSQDTNMGQPKILERKTSLRSRGALRGNADPGNRSNAQD